MNLMNLRFIIARWAAGIGFLAVAACAFAQTSGTFLLELRITSNPIGPIEPLQFQLVITNTGTQDIQGLAPWADHTTVVVEFLAPGTSDWQALEVPRLNSSMQKMPTGGLPGLALRAKES